MDLVFAILKFYFVQSHDTTVLEDLTPQLNFFEVLGSTL
jgi:hypothetical protein